MKTNHVVLEGTLTQDVELFKSKNGTSYTKFSISCKREGKREWNDYIHCVAFGESADGLAKNPLKGTPYHIEGHIQTGSYTKQNGEKVYTTDIIVESFQLIEDNPEDDLPY